MRFPLPALLLAITFAMPVMAAEPVLLIHGGAGVIKRDLDSDKEKAIRADLRAAPDIAFTATTALDASDRSLVHDLHLAKPLIAAINGHALGGGSTGRP